MDSGHQWARRIFVPRSEAESGAKSTMVRRVNPSFPQTYLCGSIEPADDIPQRKGKLKGERKSPTISTARNLVLHSVNSVNINKEQKFRGSSLGVGLSKCTQHSEKREVEGSFPCPLNRSGDGGREPAILSYLHLPTSLVWFSLVLFVYFSKYMCVGRALSTW